ncbi:MAG TPA: hypothetical protein VLJ14_03535 [Ktedonobacterales bacterium]|jgi:hypothetical protein|nr:hypothetical protein [Ktedonobacterales bacterium]
MLESRRESGEDWEAGDPARAAASARGDVGCDDGPFADMEPGWRAVRSLMQLRSDDLLAVMLRPSFRPVRDLDLVRVAPCPYCKDGGLRTAGSVRVRKGRVTVRACDTCATVDIGETPLPRAPSA